MIQRPRGEIIRFHSAAEAIAQGYTFPDKAKDKDATPECLKDYQVWLRFENSAGQLSVPVWLDDDLSFAVVQMYPPK